AAYAKRRRNSFEPCLAMRQEWSNRIFDSDAQRTRTGAPIRQRLLAILEQDLVEIAIRADERKLPCSLVEDDPVCIRTVLYPASKKFFELGRLAQAPMSKMDADWVQTAVRPGSAKLDKQCNQKFHLLPIGMSGDPSVAHGNREVPGGGAFQNDARIADR